MKVGVNIGLTLCTDEEQRNFARFGFDIAEIDTDGDIEAQAKEGVAACITVIGEANNGLEIAVKESIGELESTNPSGLTEDVAAIRKTLSKVTSVAIPKIVKQVQELTKAVDGKDTK